MRGLRGFILSLDAIFAISILIVVSLLLSGFMQTYSTSDLIYQRYYYSGKDVVYVFEQTPLSSVDHIPVIQDYMASGVLEEGDMDRTILDVIGSFWASGNLSEAGNITKAVLDDIFNETKNEYEIILSGESIYNSSEPPRENFLARLSTVVSGYEKTKTVHGYAAKVYVSKVKKSVSEFVYFGGYIGEGNMTRIVSLPDDANVTDVYLELNAGNNFTMYVNGNHTGDYEKTAYNFSADKWTVCSKSVNPVYCSYFRGGNNRIDINFSIMENCYIGGGYMRITYKTSELTESEYIYGGDMRGGKYDFPGIKGIINLYSSFYVPGTLQNISVRLHYRNNLSTDEGGIPVYFVMGANEIYRSGETGEHDVYIPDMNITGIFGGKSNLTRMLSNVTVPIRFGTESFYLFPGVGRSDSILITDRSGSMFTSCDVDSPSCPHPDCNSMTSGCQNSRIDVAVDVDLEFINQMLNVSGNRVGLNTYGSGLCSYHDLSNDSTSLKSRIDTYDDDDCGGTCISCGINKATETLKSQKITRELINEKSPWLYNTSYPSGSPPPDANGSYWFEREYNDSGWDSGNAIIGFENVPYSPNVDTDVGNNGGNYYLRKHFNISDFSVESAELYVLSDDRAEIYLNGYLIDNDTEGHNAKYWNRLNHSVYDGFEDGDIDGWTTGGDAEWYAYNGESRQGSWSAASGDIERNEVTWMKRDVTGPAIVEFWWKVDSRSNRNWLYYRVDGNMQDGISGDIDWSYKNDIIPPGNHTVEIGYEKTWYDWGWTADKAWVDDFKVSGNIHVDGSYFVGGENVIAVKLYNNDTDAAKFDLKMNATVDRYESMLVMSDGSANRCIPNWDCDGTTAAWEAVNKSCEARDKYGIKVYSVAFGEGANQDTLRRIACWNCSANDWIPDCDKFYNSSNADELKDIYKEIAEDMSNITYEAQLIDVSGNVSMENVLYPDSCISFNYSSFTRTLEYGEITLNFESPRLGSSTGQTLVTDNETGTKEGWFNIPSNSEFETEIIESKITSYSSYYWTDRLWVNSSETPNQNWTLVYWLGNFSDDYEILGDPYFIQIPPALLRAGGNNSFRIGTGLGPVLSEGRGGSPDDRVIYTLGIKGISLTTYSDILPKAKGSRPTIYYDSNGDNVPESSVTVDVGPEPDDVFDPNNDSIDSGFMKLMDTMNFINDLNPNIVDLNHTSSGPDGTGDGSAGNPIDLEVTEEVEFQSNFISQIPSLWGPATLEVRIWK